jgi:hypothetical protein
VRQIGRDLILGMSAPATGDRAYNLVFACLLLTTLAGPYGGRRILALGIALLDRRTRSVQPWAERRDRNRGPRAHRAN